MPAALLSHTFTFLPFRHSFHELRMLLVLVPLYLAAGVAANAMSTDATCGGVQGFSCPGSVWGQCCSRAGWWCVPEFPVQVTHVKLTCFFLLFTVAMTRHIVLSGVNRALATAGMGNRGPPLRLH